MRGQMRIVARIPVGIINPVQNTCDPAHARAQCLLHAHPQRAVADLPRIGRTDRRDGVGEFYARFQGVDESLPQIVLIEQGIGGAQSQIGRGAAGHDALVGDVVNRQYRLGSGQCLSGITGFQ